eukprot:506185_1
MSTDKHRYDPAYHFRKDLKSQGCGCFCNAFCWANLWLFLWLTFNIIMILLASFCVYVMYSPTGTIIWDCDKNADGIMEKCDPRQMLEDNGYTQAAAVAWLVWQCIITLVNIFGFIGLWNCIPWMILITVLLSIFEIIWTLVVYIYLKAYYYIFWLIIPLLLICFFFKYL